MLLNISKKTKIVATIGPASDNPDTFLELYKAGMSVMRINMSHGIPHEVKAKIKLARDLEAQDIYIPVCLDTKGPEIRCGLIKDGKVEILTGAKLTIYSEEIEGDETKFSTTHADLYKDVAVGNHILIDDGNLDLLVTGIDMDKKLIFVEAQNHHPLKSRKGINCPFSRLSVPYISEKDESDLKLGCEEKVDAVFASFVRRPEDIADLRAILKKYGGENIPIFAKIENPEGLQKVDQIIEVADGIMVARGDLGVEIPPEEVPYAQKHMIEQCRKRGKPVITATQMLDSMCTHPRPTRAEVTDVATAVSMGSDCVMLSAETASGEYPRLAVEMQSKISHSMETILNYTELAREAYETSEKSNNDAIANAVANTAILIGAKLIINFTETGKSTSRISKARPCCPIISVTNNRATAMRGAWQWGVYSKLINCDSMPDFIEEMEVIALKIARNLGLNPGDPILLSGGTPTGAGQTNFMRILKVNEVRDLD